MAIALSVLQSHYLSNSAIYWSRETPHPRGTEQFWSPNYLDMKFPFHLILKAHWNSNCKRRCLKALRHRRYQSAARKKRAMRRGRGRGRGAPRGRWPASTSAWAPAPVRPPWKRFGSWFRAASRSWRLCHLAASTGTTRETTPLATRAWRNAPNDFVISFLPSFPPSHHLRLFSPLLLTLPRAIYWRFFCETNQGCTFPRSDQAIGDVISTALPFSLSFSSRWINPKRWNPILNDIYFSMQSVHQNSVI